MYVCMYVCMCVYVRRTVKAVHHVGSLLLHRSMSYQKACLGWVCIRTYGNGDDYYVHGSTMCIHTYIHIDLSIFHKSISLQIFVYTVLYVSMCVCMYMYVFERRTTTVDKVMHICSGPTGETSYEKPFALLNSREKELWKKFEKCKAAVDETVKMLEGLHYDNGTATEHTYIYLYILSIHTCIM